MIEAFETGFAAGDELQRHGDVVRMRWSDFDGRYISVTQEKTGEHVAVRVHRDLRAALMSVEYRGEFICT